MIASRRVLIVVAALFLLTLGVPWGGIVQTASAQISVSSAEPSTGEQGTLNLSVVITGKGFKNGAKAKFYKTGTTDPAGVNSKSTQYVSSTQLLANIDIADTAALSAFDIVVQNTDNRSGKGTGLFSVVQKGSGALKLDVPLAVSFDDTGSPGWYGDGKGAYVNSSPSLVALIQFHDYAENGIGGGFTFELGGSSGRTVTFDFGAPLPLDPSDVCPDHCPGPPEEALPDFSVDPVRQLYVYTMFGYSLPNYDFLNPGVCDYDGDGESDWVYDGTGSPYCVTDVTIRLVTASKKEYRLRASPNVWRAIIAPKNVMLYGAMKVRYWPDLNQWTLEPLLSHAVNGVVQQEPCPALLERKVVVKGMNTYKFVGCYELPFLLRLTKR